MDWFAAEDYELGRTLFQRGLAVIYVVAFLSAANQFRALLGSGGLLPIPAFVRRMPFWDAPSLFQLFRLVLQLSLQPRKLLGQLLLGPFRGVCLQALAVGVELPLVLVAQLAFALAEFRLEGRFDLGAQGACQGDLLATGRARDGLVGHDPSLRRGRDRTGHTFSLR